MSEALKTDLLLNELEYGYDLTPSEELIVGTKRKTLQSGDLRVVSAEDNLGQAIVLRLKTRKGELADFGHPDYGSRLYELIGEPNNERTRALLRSIIIECLEQEPRIKQVLDVKLSVATYSQSIVSVDITIIPVDRNTQLSFNVPIRIEG